MIGLGNDCFGWYAHASVYSASPVGVSSSFETDDQSKSEL